MERVLCVSTQTGSKPRNPDLVRLGSRVRGLRQAAGLTQQQLADAISMTRVTLVRFEAGDTDLGSSRLFTLARALGVEPAQLLEGSTDE
jgi:transcriptional regulator with XRE-family HTH domain